VIKPRSQKGQRTRVEKTLLRFAREMPEYDEVSLTDDLFTYDGGSIALAQLTIQIEEHYDIEFPFVKIFECTTLSDLATEVHKIRLEKKMTN
jgi:acyl carrier protein